MIAAQLSRFAGLAQALERRVLDRIAERRLSAADSAQAWRRADRLWPTFTSEP